MRLNPEADGNSRAAPSPHATLATATPRPTATQSTHHTLWAALKKPSRWPTCAAAIVSGNIRTMTHRDNHMGGHTLHDHKHTGSNNGSKKSKDSRTSVSDR